MSFTPAQEAFVKSKDPFPAFVGGYGSGKTAGAIARIMRLKRLCPTGDVAYYLPTYGLIDDVVKPRMEAMFDRLGLRHKFNGRTTSMETDLGRIVFRNMDNPARIVGYEVAHSICDELDTLEPIKARNVWVKIIARNRQKARTASGLEVPNSVGVATTPEGFRFVYDRWQKNPAPGYVMFKARTVDNAANLPTRYIEDLRNSYPANLLRAYLDGEFVNLTAGSVYPEFDRHLNFSAERIRSNDLERETLHIGMDFNVNHMAAVVHVLRGDEPHAVMEFTDVADTPAMIRLIKTRYKDLGHPIMVYPDASGSQTSSNNASQSDLSLLRAAMFRICVNPANPAVKDRVMSVNAMIHADNKRRYRVNPETCPMLVESLEKQPYNKQGEPDKSAGLDHIVDGAGYFLVYKYPLVRRTVSTGKLGILS